MLALRDALSPAPKLVTRELPVERMRLPWAPSFHSTLSALVSSAASSLLPNMNLGWRGSAAGAGAGGAGNGSTGGWADATGARTK